MILTPTTAPPQARADPVDEPAATTSQKTFDAQPLKTLDISSQSHKKDAQLTYNERSGFLERLKIPTVVLETQTISHTMAAALSLSLLGHTLFLKSQVPL